MHFKPDIFHRDLNIKVLCTTVELAFRDGFEFVLKRQRFEKCRLRFLTKQSLPRPQHSALHGTTAHCTSFRSLSHVASSLVATSSIVPGAL